MKPFPKHCGVTLPHEVHSERPWWRESDWTPGYEAAGGPGWIRSDGMGVSDTTSTSPHHNEVFRHRSLYTHSKGCDISFEEQQTLTIDEILARIDAEHPLPEPRFQPGQVWLFNALQTAVVATIDVVIWPPPRDVPRFLPDDFPDPNDHLSAFGKALLPRPKPTNTFPGGLGSTPVQDFGFVIMGRYLPQFEGQSLLRSHHPDWDAYLIFDPTNPHGNVYWTAAKED